MYANVHLVSTAQSQLQAEKKGIGEEGGQSVVMFRTARLGESGRAGERREKTDSKQPCARDSRLLATFLSAAHGNSLWDTLYAACLLARARKQG